MPGGRPVNPYKAQTFAKKFVANNFNATKTIQEMQPAMSRNVAKARGADILANATYKREIVKVLEENGLTDEDISRHLRRNYTQSDNYSASNQAIEIYAKMKGIFAPEVKETRTLNLSGKDAIALLNDKIQELTKLKDELEHKQHTLPDEQNSPS